MTNESVLLARLKLIVKSGFFLTVAVAIAVAVYVATFFTFAPGYSPTPEFAALASPTQLSWPRSSEIALFSSLSAPAGQRRHDIFRTPSLLSVNSIEISDAPDDSNYFLGPESGSTWSIDGSVLVETFDDAGLYSAALIGNSDQVINGQGHIVTRIGPSETRDRTDKVNLSGLVPKSAKVRIRFSLLGSSQDVSVTGLTMRQESND